MFLDRWQLMQGDRLREVVTHGRVELYLTFSLKDVYNLFFKSFVLCFSTLKR